ncbi:hypothetical protein AB1N83_006495 [Pleurotus pulmonarius]
MRQVCRCLICRSRPGAPPHLGYKSKRGHLECFGTYTARSFRALLAELTSADKHDGRLRKLIFPHCIRTQSSSFSFLHLYHLLENVSISLILYLLRSL